MNNITINENYISLHIDSLNLPQNIDIENETLIVKKELHVSLFCVKDTVQKFGQDVVFKILEIFEEVKTQKQISFESFRKEFRFTCDPSRNRKTLVVMVNIKNLEYFYKEVRRRLDIEIDSQPTHVTLYTLKLNEGVGINNQEDLKNKTQVVTQKVPENILNVFDFN